MSIIETPEPKIWETFHLNSQTSAVEAPFSEGEVIERMKHLSFNLNLEGLGRINLIFDENAPLSPLEALIHARRSAHEFRHDRIQLSILSKILRAAYGTTFDRGDHSKPSAFRSVPSGGALYPLELYFYTDCVDSLEEGLYYYNPVRSTISLLRKGDLRVVFRKGFVQKEVADQASLIIFVTSLFERSTFKYGDRGYRFCLLEAGHVAQNINLMAIEVGLKCLNIGGFLDARIDKFLELDGLAHSTLYIAAVG